MSFRLRIHEAGIDKLISSHAISPGPGTFEDKIKWLWLELSIAGRLYLGTFEDIRKYYGQAKEA